MIAVHLAAQPFFAAGVINGLGHAVGYRSFEMPSTATNLLPWGLLLGGEELHNNHHAFPRSARFAVQRWELDIGWLWIRLFQGLGLARVRWVAPSPHFARRAASSMTKTVNALFSHRMHVLRAYAREVVLPVCRELARARTARGAAARAAASSSCATRPCWPRKRAAACASCWSATRCCAAWSSTASRCSSCGTRRPPIRRARSCSCATGAGAPKTAASVRCATLRSACAPYAR